MTDITSTYLQAGFDPFEPTICVQKALSGKLSDPSPPSLTAAPSPPSDQNGGPHDTPLPPPRPQRSHFHGNPRHKPESLPRNIREIYCQSLIRKVQYLPLARGFIQQSEPQRRAGRIKLDRVYIDQTAQLFTSHQTEQGGDSDASPASRPTLRALQAAASFRHLVITGDPGGGKSTFAGYLTLLLAVRNSQNRPKGLKQLRGWPESEQDLLPVPVNLPDFNLSLEGRRHRPSPRLLWDFILDELKRENLVGAARLLRTAFEQGKAILILDGLDEIPQTTAREAVRDTIIEFAERYPFCRIIVTCRSLTYTEPECRFPDFPVVRLMGFVEGLQSHFIHLCYKELAQIGEIASTAQADARCRELQKAIRNPQLQALAGNPLMLTLMALVHLYVGQLPASRAAFCETAVDVLLWRWDQIKSRGRELLPPLRWLYLDADCNCSDDDIKRVITALAFQAYDAASDKSVPSDINEISLLRSLAALHPEASMDWADKVVRTLKLRAGLLINQKPETYTFSQRPLQAYLAGAHLAARPDFSRFAQRLMEMGPRWREVIIMAVNRMIYHEKDRDKALALAAELCSARAPMGNLLWRQTHLAAEILAEIGPEWIQESALAKDLQERIQSRMLALVQGDHLNPDDRVTATRYLKQTDKARSAPKVTSAGGEIISDPLLRFMKIPAGPFFMGSDPRRDPRASKEEQPYHTLKLPTYYISKHPVTVGQFRIFAKHAPHPPKGGWEAYADRDDLPVVSVSWYDAAAFCEWLNGVLKPVSQILRNADWVVRLPTEAEWEKAARGTDGRVYPWGNEPDETAANFEKSGADSVKPVGSFPKGISPFKCHDMAGNIWEWTHSLWGKSYDQPTFRYPYTVDDGREDSGAGCEINRVVRGGAFSDEDWAIRCAFRIAYVPDSGLRELGFRVAIGPRLDQAT